MGSIIIGGRTGGGGVSSAGPGTGHASAPAPRLAFSSGAEGGYGPPLPVVYGTGLVKGRVVLIDNRQSTDGLTGLQKYTDVWASTETGVWSPTGTSFCSTAEIAVCQGPAYMGNYLKVGQNRVAALYVLGRHDENGVEWVPGDGTETAWSRLALVAGAWEARSALIPANGIYTVPDPGTWFADGGVSYQYWGYHSTVHVDTWARVDGDPAAGEYRVAAGTYVFSAADANKLLNFRFQRSTAVAGWSGSAVALRHTAHVQCDALPLASENALPSVSFVVRGLLGSIPVTDITDGSTVWEAHPADVIVDLYGSEANGLGYDAAQIDVDHGADGLTASSYRTYCSAMEFSFSRAIMEVTPTRDLFAQALLCTNSIAVPSAGRLKIIPLGDVAVGAYVPPGIAYAINEDELTVEVTDGDASSGQSLRQDPVRGTRTLQEDTYTCWPVSYLDRRAYYESQTIYATVVDPLDPTMVTRAPTTDLPWVCRWEMAMKLSALMAQRSLHIRNTYEITLGPRWCVLEPGDLISISEPVTFGIGEAVTARIRTIEEQEDGSLTCYAEEYPAGVGHVVQLVSQGADGQAHGLGSSSWASNYGYQGTGSGVGANLLPNSDFSQGAPTVHDVPAGGYNVAANTLANITVGLNLAGSTWILNGDTDPKNVNHSNTLAVKQDGNQIDVDLYCEVYAPSVAVIPGRRYAGSWYVQAWRAKCDLYLAWHKADGSTSTVKAFSYPLFSNGASSQAGPNINNAENTTPLNAQSLADYRRLYVVDNAPSDAASCVVVLRKWDTKPERVDSWIFTCRGQFEEVGPYATLPGPWVPSATIPGPGSIGTGQLGDGSVSTGKLGDGSVSNSKQSHTKSWSVINNNNSTRGVSFSVAEPDNNYFLQATVSGRTGTPYPASDQISGFTKNPTNFIVEFMTPSGTSGTVTFDVTATGLRNGG